MTVEVRVWLPREVTRGGADVVVGTVDIPEYAGDMACILDTTGWTALTGVGSWAGTQEGIIVVSILVDEHRWEKSRVEFYDYIRKLQAMLGQDAILVAQNECRPALIAECS